MDASQYKDYILTLLFVKYVTDRFKGDPDAEIEIPEGGSFEDLVAAKGKSDIGDKINKIVSALAEANGLASIIDQADFDDDKKLGDGKDKVTKLSNLIAIFEDEKLNFKKNRAGGDDIIGDAYEYLMRKFAQDSGKSKGQFYTPAEVSRVMAKLIEIDKAPRVSCTVYDPACGSGSLLIRAADESPHGVTIYGQEYDPTTAGLAKMNLVLHNKSTGDIANANTLADPRFKTDNVLDRYDFAVANPPFSYSAWRNGVDTKGDIRFQNYGALPPEKNGDFAWLMHFIYSLKPEKGKGAIILPHGVLFRGNAEATIRKEIIKKRFIKGIIGLPANLFYGTGIPACIIVIDKENTARRTGIFMIDASREFIKDGDKNRLREQDIRKIVDYFNGQIPLSAYSRFICKHSSKIDTVSDQELQAYVSRIVANMTAEQLADMEQTSLSYAKKIKDKVTELLAIHTKEVFIRLVEQNQIRCEPHYMLKSTISPTQFTSKLPKSLYTSEEKMNEWEHDVVWELSSLSNIKWWHRNMSRSGFYINGNINTYPDIIAMTENGNILLIEPKGDHLENTESRQKLALGRTWQNKAGSNYHYYMVFKNKDLKLEGAYLLKEFLETVKGL